MKFIVNFIDKLSSPKDVKSMRKAIDYAEKYIFESEGNNRKNKLAKYKELFFKYN